MVRKLSDYLPRELRQKRQIVLRVDDQRLPRPPRKFVEVDHRANGAEQVSQIREINSLLEAFADVTSGLSVPDHIGKIGGRVVEGRDTDSRIVRGGNERVTRTQAGTDNSEAAVALRFQPVEAGANVSDSLD